MTLVERNTENHSSAKTTTYFDDGSSQEIATITDSSLGFGPDWVYGDQSNSILLITTDPFGGASTDIQSAAMGFYSNPYGAGGYSSSSVSNSYSAPDGFAVRSGHGVSTDWNFDANTGVLSTDTLASAFRSLTLPDGSAAHMSITAQASTSTPTGAAGISAASLTPGLLAEFGQSLADAGLLPQQGGKGAAVVYDTPQVTGSAMGLLQPQQNIMAAGGGECGGGGGIG